MANYIQKLISQGEHQHLDFKYKISDAHQISKSFAAFANASGGKLLIGVNDNGVITGLRNEEELYLVNAAGSYYCIPPVSYNMCGWEWKGKTVLEVNIPEGTQKPYYAKRKNKPPTAYIRIADRNIKVCSVQLMVWEKQKNPTGLFIGDADDIRWLLSLLEKYPKISIVTVCRLLMISYQTAVRLLADLVYLNILEIEYQNDRVFFRTKK